MVGMNNRMIRWSLRYLISVAILVAVWQMGISTVQGQSDRVFRKAPGGGTSQLRGKIVASSAFGVSIESDEGTVEVPASEVHKLVFADEPRNVSRARDHLENERFSECLDAITKLDSRPNSKLLNQEIQFMEAYSTGRLALRNNSEIDSAQQLIGDFVKANSDSYRLAMAIDLGAQLLMAGGKIEQAQKEYVKLTNSRWDEYVARGYFFQGESLIQQNDWDAAAKSFALLAELVGEDTVTREYRSLARVQLIKLAALTGNPAAAIPQLEEIIQQEDVDNTRMLAYAYNALGTAYQQAGDLKKASRAYLHTELLFSSDPNATAEALYHLTRIWTDLNRTDRANRARDLLTGRYGNTAWARKP